MSEQFEVETLRGKVIIEFGVNRWVVVSIGSDEGQIQIDRRQELAAYLRNRGLSDREASEFSEEAWKQRPRSATDHLATPDEGFVAATGFSTGWALVLVLAIVAAFLVITVYVFVVSR